MRRVLGTTETAETAISMRSEKKARTLINNEQKAHAAGREKRAHKTHSVEIYECKKKSREPNLKCRDQIQDFGVLNAKT